MDKILSIVVASYNMEAYLPKCLGSLIIADRELLQKVEVIVVNDGSKDRTSEIAHGFEARYPGVFVVLDKPNGHYGSCINAALSIASGEYIRTLDADDSVDTEGFHKFLCAVVEECQKKDKGADLIITDYMRVDPDGKEINRSRLRFAEKARTLADLPEGYERLENASISYRTKNVKRIGYHQSEGMSYTDCEWLTEPMVTVRTIRYVPVVVILYLNGRDGQTMDPKMFSRSFQNILTITRGIVERHRDYVAICEKTSLSYYHRQIVSMLRMCYYHGLFGYKGVRMQCDLEGFDKFLSEFPEFYSIPGDWSFGPNHFPFRYVEYFRKYGYGLRWRLRRAFNDFLLWGAGLVGYPKIRALFSNKR